MIAISNSQLSTAKARILSHSPVVVLKTGGSKSKLTNASTYDPHTGGIGPNRSTKYFGSIEYQESDVVQFSSGLPAFEDETQFLLIEPAASAPIIFLQSLRQASLCFLTLPILAVDPQYDLAVTWEDLQSLGLEPGHPPPNDAGLTCLAVVAVTENGAVNANLLAPVLINRRDRRGLQAIRVDSLYSHEHPVTALSGVQKEDACS